MKRFLVIAIINKKGFFIYDTYADFIVEANDKDEASRLVMVNVQDIVEIDEVSEIDERNSSALIKINRTKNITDFITEVIMF